MKWIGLLIYTIWIFLPSFAVARITGPFESSVVASSNMWSTPGYSLYDCRAGEKNFNPRSSGAKEAIARYKEPDVKTMCEKGKGDHLESGETVDLVDKGDGNPVVVTLKMKVGSIITERDFYLVKNPSTGKQGWMSSEYISEPRRKTFEAPRTPLSRTTGECLPCSSDSKDFEEKVEQLRRDGADLATAVSRMPFGGMKTEAELDRFACLYRDMSVSADTFAKILPQIQRSAKAAEKAFGIPAPVLRCTMLVESALVASAKSKMKASGYAGVLDGTIDQLETVSERMPLKENWEKYKKDEPNAAMDRVSVRLRSTVPSSMGAIALYSKHMQIDYIAKSCNDCYMPDGSLSRKGMYLMIIGYNAGPGLIQKVAHKNPVEMMTSRPPPDETRGYFIKMDRCLQADHEASFVESPKDIADSTAKRKKELQDLIDAQQKRTRNGSSTTGSEDKVEVRKAYLQKLISMKASKEYELHLKECDAKFPAQKH
jgi:hypothetical protein